MNSIDTTISLAEITRHYFSVRTHSCDICRPLAIEDYVVQPVAAVSPPKWHLAHTTWFFEELILRHHLPGYQRFDERFSELFNSYYKAAGKHWLQGERGQLSRPTVEQVYAYRAHVDAAMQALLHSGQCNAEVQSLLEIGLHHEQQHQELLYMDIKFILGANPLCPTYSDTPLPRATALPEQWLSWPEGVYEIGHHGNSYCFDNEMPRHKTYLHAYAIRNTLVTNGEYLEFIDAGGYSDPRHWLSMGWDWLQANAVQHPLYWHQAGGEQWYEFTLHGGVPLDMHAPVAHISYFEANAYAKWRGLRLPTEQELELYLVSADRQPEQDAGIYHPLHGDRAAGQLWCWTQSQYTPYPGFESYEGMLEEYNGKFMCNQFVLRGGCVVTPAGHSRPTYRNFYTPEQQWMFSGIRLAQEASF